MSAFDEFNPPRLPQPQELKYHQDPKCYGYWLYEDLRIQADVDTHRFVVRYAQQHFPGGTDVLDVGAGQGALAKELLDCGYNVSCTAWNDKCRAPVPVYRVDLDRPFSIEQVGGRPYSLICCIEIIEHLENPASFLRHCATLLTPEGRLLLSTPNVESAAARLQWLIRGRPLIFSSDEIRRNRHISMMWREGLEHLIQLAGLQILEKHLLGRFWLPRSLLSLVKVALYHSMFWTLRGDTRGNTRLYVLGLSGLGPKQQGTGEVF
jgi:2-polyprenyl-3-methyl-5-hydroxy-6-metoxy-1,4-benzoquinol methylase